MGTIVITGGAAGIGRATALLAAQRGYDTAIMDLPAAEPAAKEVVTEVEGYGRRAVALAADVTVERDVVGSFAQVVERLGPITGLVNGAGLLYSAKCTEIDAAEVRATMAVNVTGLMLCSREAARLMMHSRGGHGGCIVNISSMAATIGGRHRGAVYAASKAAVDAYTTGMAKEVAAEGIRVNAVRPGLVATGLTAALLEDPARRQAIEESIPLGRVGAPADVAEAALWLLAEKNNWISGAHLDVSGGGFFVSGSF
ncbi:MAG: SDR family oxidoreductase [Streptosporangiales bacterium]|nr:SDR family oxidoreductase [Streptosporangiales bacterium]